MQLPRALTALLLTAGLGACAGNPQPAAPAPQALPAQAPAVATTPAAATVRPAAPAPAPAAVDISGDWTFSVDAGDQTVGGTMSLARSGTTWTGQVFPEGMPAFQLRSAQVTGDRVQLVLDGPDGEATIDGLLSADRRSISGVATYQGQAMTFSATKR
jgi:hypothetical protein